MFNKAPRTGQSASDAQPSDPTMDIYTDEALTAEQAAALGNGELESCDVNVGDSGEVEEWKGKYQLLQDQFARLAADFDNYRKRTREEQESLVKYGAQKSITELFPVLDNIERAAATLNENSDPAVLFKSFNVVYKQLLDGLDAMGVRKIQAIGQPFDPQFHEAVNRMPSNEFPEDTVMYEAQSGYQLHDKVVRPAMVVVSTGSADEATDSAENDEAKQPAENSGNPFRR